MGDVDILHISKFNIGFVAKSEIQLNVFIKMVPSGKPFEIIGGINAIN